MYMYMNNMCVCVYNIYISLARVAHTSSKRAATAEQYAPRRMSGLSGAPFVGSMMKFEVIRSSHSFVVSSNPNWRMACALAARRAASVSSTKRSSKRSRIMKPCEGAFGTCSTCTGAE